MPERAYLSIGEVLALLKDEFTDITISKIRFLESQGLIDPERTPSGYRKFYDQDVERLRWILRQQKEHYLPLRVIKGKLSEAPPTEDDASETPATGTADHGDDLGDQDLRHDEAEVTGPAPTLAAVPDPPADAADAADANGSRRPTLEPVTGDRPRQARADSSPGPAATAEAEPAPGTAAARDDRDQAQRGRRAVPPFPESLRRSARTSPAAFLTAPDSPAPERRPQPPPARPPASAEPPVDELDLGDEEVEMTADELAAASGLPQPAVAELERYGLVKGQPGPGGRYYDAAALEIAQLAAAFARFGVEARHLRMWKTAADREADFYEQVVTPLRSQRSNKARRQAGDAVTELADLGARLHAALVAGAMKRLT